MEVVAWCLYVALCVLVTTLFFAFSNAHTRAHFVWDCLDDSPDEEAEVPSDEEPNVTGKEAKEYQKKKRAPSVPTEMNAEEEIVAIIKGNSFKIVNLFMYIVFMVIFVLNLQFRKNTYTEFGITNAVHGSIIHTEFQHSPNNFLLFKDLKNEV